MSIKRKIDDYTSEVQGRNMKKKGFSLKRFVILVQ
jgi:hypothetical protein